MVTKEKIEEALNKSVDFIKCTDYPKAIALRNFNEANFTTETYPPDTNTKTLPSPVGRLQQQQADLQEQIDYKSLEKGVVHDYATDSFIPIGMYLNDVPNWEDECDFIRHYIGDNGEFMMPVIDEDNDKWVDVSVRQEVNMLSEIIDKSPRVQEDSVVYRYGELPLDIDVGRHGKFKSFLSTSYNPFIAFEDIPDGGLWVQGEKNVRYKMRIFTPKGTKGIVINDHSSGGMDWQSELLIDKGQRYIVLARDDVNMTADILLY